MIGLMKRRITLDRKIQSILDRGPMAALYFAVAANVLRQTVEQNDDRFVSGLFGGLIDAATIRRCVKVIDETLNDTK